MGSLSEQARAARDASESASAPLGQVHRAGPGGFSGFAHDFSQLPLFGGLTGTVPDVVTAPGEGRGTEQEDIGVADLAHFGGPGNVSTDITLNFTQERTTRHGGSKHDPAVSGVAIGAFSQPDGRAVSPFGEEFYEPAFSSISYAFAGGKCKITAKLDIHCPFGTDGGGKTDVPSATDAVVTKANWAAVKADLMPGAASPFKSPRTSYYSQALVERHEKFHGTDDLGWSKSSGLAIATARIEAGTADKASAAADVTALLDASRTKLINENFKWYKGGGASHGAYAGEIRAYADGKPEYTKLANAVEAHGKTLP